MINTDVIEQISKVELKREFMRPHFSVKYIFDAVQMFFKGDNRIQTNGTKNSKINFTTLIKYVIFIKSITFCTVRMTPSDTLLCLRSKILNWRKLWKRKR